MTAYLPNMARSGIGLQALFYMGHVGEADTLVAAGRNAVNLRWTNPANFRTSISRRAATTTDNNKGCAYAMFNVFKG